MLVAGLVAPVHVSSSNRWGSTLPLQPSPAEKSIETRFMWGTGSIIFMLLILLLVGDWIVAGRAARNLLQERLQSLAQLASQNVPFFLETGQNLGLAGCKRSSLPGARRRPVRFSRKGFNPSPFSTSL